MVVWPLQYGIGKEWCLTNVAGKILHGQIHTVKTQVYTAYQIASLRTPLDAKVCVRSHFGVQI